MGSWRMEALRGHPEGKVVWQTCVGCVCATTSELWALQGRASPLWPHGSPEQPGASPPATLRFTARMWCPSGGHNPSLSHDLLPAYFVDSSLFKEQNSNPLAKHRSESGYTVYRFFSHLIS